MIQNNTSALLLLAATFAIATPAFSQAPSEAQREAIKSSCRNDYIAHCSSIPPGGAASLQCLQKNMASLSAACAGAVKAAEAPAETRAEPAAVAPKEEPKQETRTEPAPAAAPAKSAAEPAKGETKSETKAAAAPAGKPTSAQISAIRANCRSDYPKVCAGVPTGGAAALECLEKNKARLSAACGKALAAAGGGGAPAAGSVAPASANAAPAAGAAAGAAPATTAAAAPLVLRPMRPREILFVARSACGADVRALCAGVPAGGGRIIECLASQPAALSPACRDVLGQFAAR
jgi:hypothetical protein